MKAYLRIPLAVVLVLGLGASRASAGDEAWAALGGFVAGVITGSAIDSHDAHGHLNVTVGGRYGSSYYDHHRHDCRKVRCYDRGWGRGRPYRSGHWEYRRLKVWVPGRWEVIVNHHGDRIRVWNRGYHTWRQDRVWIPYGGKRHDRYYGRDDRRGHNDRRGPDRRYGD